MNTTRLEQLFAFLKEEPNEPFNIYAIAMEYLKGSPQKALEYFEILLNAHESYVPTYYHAANLYTQLGKLEKAKATYEKGLAISLQQGNRHAYRELQNAYNLFIDELDD